MNKLALQLTLLATALACLLPAGSAQAQIRVFVSQTGADTNPCTFVSPCKSAQHAHDVAAAGGEILMLDAGGYGKLTITKAITILGGGHGELALTTFSNSAAVTINANATDKITLRGLVIEGLDLGEDGIKFNSGDSLYVQDCLIHHFDGNGIKFAPSATSTLMVSNTIISKNVNTGVTILPGLAGSAKGVFDRVEISNNRTRGLDVLGSATGTVNVNISESTVASNAQYGVGSTGNGRAVTVTVKSSTIANNGIGLLAFGNPTAILRVTRSTITGNTTGISAQVTGVLVSPRAPLARART